MGMSVSHHVNSSGIDKHEFSSRACESGTGELYGAITVQTNSGTSTQTTILFMTYEQISELQKELTKTKIGLTKLENKQKGYV
jgi:hypothetical protein